ncbi:MAG TPA: hypothetical protein VJW20_04815 [Candidatus Angelobacter sp.]|nr:hypothetical protein [Candidatus Angelobacter sp.]
MLATRKLQLSSLLILFLSAAAFCQNAPQLAPVPPDPFELVTGATQVPSTPEDRSAVLGLLERARQNGDLHAAGSAAYTMHVSFNASGNVLVTGAGEMEETWFSPAMARWTAHLGDFSLDRIFNDGRTFDDKVADFIPIRLQMLRGAIFWPINFKQAHTLIRTAAVKWKGKDLTCALVSGDMSDATATPGRRWEEREFCIENKTGLLQVLSDAPGIYILYDYTNALRFHGHVLPSQFKIVESGNTVLESHLESIADAISSPDLLAPSAQMKANGQGPLLGGTMRFPRTVPVAPGAAAVQPVIVHAILDRHGKVGDAELVGNPDSALGQSALEFVKRGVYPQVERMWAGHQMEAFINVRFVSQ